MKKKLIALAAIMAVAALFAARMPQSSVHANPASDGLTVKFTACTGIVSGCNGDLTVDAGEPVTTTVHTDLPTPNSSFYDSVRSISDSITPGVVPTGDVVGTGQFTIKLDVTTTCSSASGTLTAPPYTIYATNDPAVVPTQPTNGYAKGLTAAEVTAGGWAALYAPNWIQDFDDDNNNNVPDFAEGGSGASTLPMTTRDLTPANGRPDGVDREPLYLPILDLLQGKQHDRRNFGVAVVAPGVLEVPVDFVTYINYPTAGRNTLLAVIQEGAALNPSILPANNSANNQQTCPPFTSDITLNAFSSSGAVVQTATSGTYQFDVSSAADTDSDGVPDYQDNCKFVKNGLAEALIPGVGNQTDTDGNKIGDACDTGAAPGVPICPGPNACTATDWDGDGFANYTDSCPYQKNVINSDGDGIDNACDPAPSIVGDGYGYQSSSPGPGCAGCTGQYHDHDSINTAAFTLPAASNTVFAGTSAPIIDANDNHTPDGAENGSNPAATPYFVLGSGRKAGDADGDGILDGVDPNPLDPGGRVAKCGGDCGQDKFTISSNTAAGPSLITTSAIHDFLVGEVVTITGSNSTPSINGTWTVLSIGPGVCNPTPPPAETCTTLTTTAPTVTVAGTAGTIRGFPNVYGDGCNDAFEATLSIDGIPLTGTTPWETYFVPSPALFAAPSPKTTFRQNSATIGGVQSVFAYFKGGAKLGTVIYNQDLNQNNVMDGVEYDRTLNGPGPTLGPDGNITIKDVQKIFAEFKAGLSCTSSPGYNMGDSTWWHGGTP